MKQNRYIWFAVGLLMALLFVACSSQSQLVDTEEATALSGTSNAPDGAESEDSADPGDNAEIGLATDLESLVEALEASGANVAMVGTVSQPFFTPEGQVISVNGQDVQLFEYDSAAEAEAEAALVSADGGSVGTMMMSWIAPPHFFRNGVIITLYVGEDSDVRQLLESTLGPQFAGQ